MVNISKKKLSEDILSKINSKFIDTIYNLESKKSVGDFINDILTPSEKIVLTKRLTIIFMLQEDLSLYRIHKILNVSEATVRRIGLILDKGGYSSISKIVKKKKNREMFWSEFRTTFNFKIKYKNDKRRWDFLDDIYGKYGL